MPAWILLVPIFLPLIAAPVLTRAQRARVMWITGFSITQAIAIVINVLPGSHRLIVSDWQAGAWMIALRVDGIAILLWLTLWILFAAIWIAAPRAPFDGSGFAILSAAFLFIAADGIPAILIAWMLIDLALFARALDRDTAARSLITGSWTALIAFTGAILISAGRASEGSGLIAIAFWARLAIFPFHSILPQRGADASDLWIARAVPVSAGAVAWIRWIGDAPGDWMVWLALGAFISAIVWMTREEDPARAVVVSSAPAIPGTALAIAFGGAAGPAFALWITISALIAFACFEMALRWRADNRNRYPRLLWFAGIFALADAPLTPGFLGRVGVYIALWESGQWIALGVIGIATAILIAPLWNFAFELQGAETRDPKRSEIAALIILALIGGVFAIAIVPITQALGAPMIESVEAALGRVIWTNDVIGVILSFVFLFAPLIGSYFLRGIVREVRPRPSSILLRLARGFDLVWIERVIAQWGNRIGMIARSLSAIAEENPTLWLLLAGLWVAILILVAR